MKTSLFWIFITFINVQGFDFFKFTKQLKKNFNTPSKAYENGKTKNAITLLKKLSSNSNKSEFELATYKQELSGLWINAINKQDNSFIKNLLDSEFSPNIEIHGSSPLFMAATFSENPKLLELLFSYGARFNVGQRTLASFFHCPCNSNTLETLLLNPEQCYKTDNQLKLSKNRIMTFLLCCKRKKIELPEDIKLFILAYIPEEIYSVTMLVALSKQFPNKTNEFMQHFPLKKLKSAIKNNHAENLYKKILTEYSQKLCEQKLKDPHINDEKTPLEMLKDRIPKDREIIEKLLNPNDKTARTQLIEANIKTLNNQ